MFPIDIRKRIVKLILATKSKIIDIFIINNETLFY